MRLTCRAYLGQRDKLWDRSKEGWPCSPSRAQHQRPYFPTEEVLLGLHLRNADKAALRFLGSAPERGLNLSVDRNRLGRMGAGISNTIVGVIRCLTTE